jgi:hypothetical protein
MSLNPRVKRWTIRIAGALALAFMVAVLLVVVTERSSSRPRIDCGPILESSRGAYRSLATVDADGCAYPFARIAIDDGSRWEIEIDDAYRGKKRTADRSLIRMWQRVRFACTQSEIATPETGFRLYRDGVVVYGTDVIFGDGLQNQEFGFLEAANRFEFWWLLFRI